MIDRLSLSDTPLWCYVDGALIFWLMPPKSMLLYSLPPSNRIAFTFWLVFNSFLLLYHRKQFDTSVLVFMRQSSLSLDASSVKVIKYKLPKIPGTLHLPQVSEWITSRRVDEFVTGSRFIFSTCLHELQISQSFKFSLSNRVFISSFALSAAITKLSTLIFSSNCGLAWAKR